MSFNIGIDARKLSEPGIGDYVQNLIHNLARLDGENRYILFVGQRHQDALVDLPENFQRVVERSPAYSVRELMALSWRLLRRRLDLYHATHYVLPTAVPCKAIVTIHDIVHLFYPEFLPNALAFFYAQRMIRRALNRADRIIADSRNTRTDLMDHFEVDGRKIRAIYPGLAEGFSATSEPQDEMWRKELGLHRPYLLFVANRESRRNLDNVIRAYAQAQTEDSCETDLVALVDSREDDLFSQQRIEQEGLRDRIILVREIAEEALPSVYRGSRLLLYPTLREGSDPVVVQAMASGIPVITSDMSALKEIAEGYAHLVNPLDVEGMARAISHCLTDEKHRQSLIKLGLRRAEDFSWQKTAEQTLEVYRSALTQEARQPDSGRSRRGAA